MNNCGNISPTRHSVIAPRRGEYDAAVRLRELEADGIAAEVIFPQMALFGAGLMMYRHNVSPAQRAAGNRAYNRFLADLCQTNPGRHAGVSVVNVDNIADTVQEIRECHAMGLWCGGPCCCRPAPVRIPIITTTITTRP